MAKVALRFLPVTGHKVISDSGKDVDESSATSVTIAKKEKWENCGDYMQK